MRRLLLALTLAPAWAGATSVTGTVIYDQDGVPVPGLQARLLDRTGQVRDEAFTDADGRFELDASSTTAAVDEEATQILPLSPRLLSPYPNPFNPTVRLSWELPRVQPLQLTIYNTLGQPVRHLLNGLQPSGTGEITWDGLNDVGKALASGVYLVELRTATRRQTRSMLMLDGVPPPSHQVPAPEPLDLTLVIDGSAVEQLRRSIDVAGDQGFLLVAAKRMVLPLANGDEYELAGVPAGPFDMGSRDFADEGPVHEVLLSSFLLGVREVTVAAYARCVSTGDCAPPATGEGCNDLASADRQDHPANCVTWSDAANFCAASGMVLPTEAQWEKAARGTVGHIYPWGNEKPGGAGNCERAVMMRAGLGLGCRHDGTAPVGERPGGRSVYGMDDLAGNVWEWTQDAYDPAAYDRTDAEDPVVEGDPGSRRVVRGNSWYYVDPNPDLRAANRYAFPARRWLPFVGFRCALVDPPSITRASAATVDPPAPVVGDWMSRNRIVRSAEGDEQPRRDPPGDEEIVDIPAGSLIMGSADGDHDERPLRRVTIDAFRIDRYEVTVGQYARCVDADVCREPHDTDAAYRISFEAHYLNWNKPAREAHPVNGVSWYDADRYCHWAGKRLPTEAEWERAARGDGPRLFPWGDEESTCERAIIDDGGDGCGHEMTWPVGSRATGASPFGVQDMAGNLWEWTADWYARDFYGRGQDDNPYNDIEGEGLKVLRGGSMADQNSRIHRSTNRLGYLPDQRYDYTVGFRCAADAVAP